MSRQIKGDPLTGSLPRTQLIVPQEVHGPIRTRKPRYKPDEWPRTPDPEAISMDQLEPGRVAYVSYRRGVRKYLIRTATRSREMGPNRGRTYVTGMSRRGWCHSFWADRIVSTQSVQQALTAGRVLKAIGPGRR